MIISRAEIESAIFAYRAAVKRKVRPAAAEPATDFFDLSQETSQLTQLASQITAEPYYRANLVTELQRRISEGHYYVPADQIVEKLLGRLIAEALPA
jgi:anti-sigma28 factor (negative regulator of flagellin synthesis)